MGQITGWPRSLTKNHVSETVLGNELRGEPRHCGETLPRMENLFTLIWSLPLDTRGQCKFTVSLPGTYIQVHNHARQLALFLSISKMRTVRSKKLSELSEATLTLCDSYSVSVTSGQSYTSYGTEASSTPGIGQGHCLQ